jgi:hypothetical protein
MADVINLRQARKRKRRADGEAEAAENRVRHGRSAAEKARLSAERSREDKGLEAHRREGGRRPTESTD